jgi:hypothetical protein
VIGRLRAFGAAPLDAALASTTLERLRRAGPAWRRLPLKVLVAATVGAFAFGGLGLAAADVLPAPVQDAAHTALDQVGVHVPPGHDRYNDPAKCPGGPYRNHGAYVRAHKNDPNAGQSPCGKPVKSIKGSGANQGNENNDAGDRPEGAGPPPWAHGNKNKHKDKSEKGNQQPASTGAHAKHPDDAPDAVAHPHTTTPPSASTTTTSTSAPPASTTSTSSP